MNLGNRILYFYEWIFACAIYVAFSVHFHVRLRHADDTAFAPPHGSFRLANVSTSRPMLSERSGGMRVGLWVNKKVDHGCNVWVGVLMAKCTEESARCGRCTFIEDGHLWYQCFIVVVLLFLCIVWRRNKVGGWYMYLQFCIPRYSCINT